MIQPLMQRQCQGVARCFQIFSVVTYHQVDLASCDLPGEEKWGEGTEDPAHALAAVDLQSTDEETAAAVIALIATVAAQ